MNHNTLKTLLHKYDGWLDKFGHMLSHLSSLLVIIIVLDVIQRYFFKVTYNWILELEWHLFGIMFLLGAAYTFQKDKHIRVDVWYQNLSSKTKNKINRFGHLLLLIPWCIIIIKTSYTYAYNSWHIKENSPNPGGLPFWFVIKFVFVISFVLLLWHAIRLLIDKEPMADVTNTKG